MKGYVPNCKLSLFPKFQAGEILFLLHVIANGKME